MNKKFLSAILFGALMVTSTGTFVSCKDYDDDIDAINSELTDIKSQLTALQSKVDAGNYVTNITKAEGGINVTFSNGTTTFIETGAVVEEEECYASAATIENGEWVIYKADGTYVKTGIPATGVLAVKNNKGGYTLTVVDAEGEITEIELPATKLITDLTATTITGGKMGKADVTLYYGAKITAENGKTFNGKTYAKGTYLISQSSKLSAIVNPLDADAAKYTFKLVDTKGNAPIVVSDIKQNMSEKALSRAASANQGVWDMTLAFADAANIDVAGTYALTTETVNGIVASPYDVTVKTEKVSSVGMFLKPMYVEGNCNEDIDIAKGFYEHELGKYIVDSYFEITDKTAADNVGVTLDGNIIKTTKNETFTFSKLKGYFLMVNNAYCEVQINVTFKKVTPTASLSDVEWTITNEDNKNVVYLPLSAIKSQLIGSSDKSLPAISENGYAWADGTELDKKSVVVNGAYYGKDVTGKTVTKFAGNEESWIATLGTQLYTIDKDGKYVAATSIQDDLYAKFTFDYEEAFPGEYIIKVAFRKDGATSGDYTLEVPVNVTIYEPTVNPFSRLSAYFNGDEATAYGEVSNNIVQYNLFSLFKEIEDEVKEDVTFTETLHDVKGHTCSPWLTTTGEKGDIEVAVFDASKKDNSDAVYSTRAIKAIYNVFGNAHITNVVDEFNLTIKSEIKEGEFTTTASKTIETSEPVMFSVTDFSGVDVFGDKFIIGETYEYDNNGKLTKVNRRDERIAAVIIEAGDEYAEDYLTIASEFGNKEGEKPAAEYFTVARKSEVTKLESDVECKVKVTLVDVWGVSSEATVTVTLKKF